MKEEENNMIDDGLNCLQHKIIEMETKNPTLNNGQLNKFGLKNENGKIISND